jgi:hypothetical protein
MKKLLLSIITVASLGAVNAQNLLTNGDFEQIASPLLPGIVTDCPGWGTGLYSMETANAFAGSQSAKMRTIVDAQLNATIGWGSDTIPGLMVQELAGPFTGNIGDMTLSYAYNYNVIPGDTAIIVCQFLDTMGVGSNDDVVLYQAYGAYTGAANAWATASTPLTAIPGAMGTANSMLVIATSSYNAVFAGQAAQPMCQFWIDNVSVGTSGANILEEVASVNVYPNPTSGILNIDATEQISEVRIFGMDGKLALTSNSNSVDMSALPLGMYHYSVTTVTGKVIQGKVSKI